MGRGGGLGGGRMPASASNKEFALNFAQVVARPTERVNDMVARSGYVPSHGTGTGNCTSRGTVRQDVLAPGPACGCRPTLVCAWRVLRATLIWLCCSPSPAGRGRCLLPCRNVSRTWSRATPQRRATGGSSGRHGRCTPSTGRGQGSGRGAGGEGGGSARGVVVGSDKHTSLLGCGLSPDTTLCALASCPGATPPRACWARLVSDPPSSPPPSLPPRSQASGSRIQQSVAGRRV